MKHYLSYIDEAIKTNWSKPALTNYGANTITYGEIASEIEKLHILFEKCGIAKGEKIALCARSQAEWCVAYLAVVTYEAVVVPLLPDFLPKNIADLTKMSDSRLLMVDKTIIANLTRDNIIPQFAEIEDFCGIVDVVGMQVHQDFSGKLAGINEAVAKDFATRYPGGVTPEIVNYAKDNFDALAVISYTSGTSASSKGVMLSSRSLSENVEYARIHIKAYNTDSLLSILPLAHIFGQVFDFLFPISSGSHVNIFTEKPIPVRLLKAIAEVKPFMFLTVPLLVEKIFRLRVMPQLNKPAMKVLLAIPGIRNIILGKVRAKLVETFGGNIVRGGIIIGGAAISKDVEAVMRAIKFPYTVGYGMTEVGPLISYNSWKKHVPRSCGRVAAPGVDVRIDSENPAKIPGEIQVKGPSVMEGYYKNEEATKATFTADGWLKTGDMGTMDKEKHIFIKGRCKNMILTTNGQNIYPEEIEELVNQLPMVMESLVVGRKHGLAALIVPNPDAVKEAGITPEELQKTMEENLFALNADLPSYAKLTICELMDEPFAKTPKLSIKRFMYK